jgi:hypothetical protein
MSDFKRNILVSIFLTALAWPMLASADYIESVNGDLSGNFLNPTSIALVPNGSTRVSGTVTGAGMGVSTDLDYFMVTVPVGQGLAALNVLPGTVGGGAIGSFIAVFAGSTAANPATAVSTDTLGYYLYRTPADIGTDILDNMGTFNFMGVNPSIGFTPPLFAGNYTFWVQEGALGTFPYNFELVLSSVPAPPTILLMGLAGVAFLGLRRRRGEGTNTASSGQALARARGEPE